MLDFLLFYLTLIKFKHDLFILQNELCFKAFTILGDEVCENRGFACGEQSRCLGYGNIALADIDAHLKGAAVGVAHTAVIVLTPNSSRG